MPRPEGVRCLLVSGRGKTVARGRNGAVLHEFPSLLPGGGGSVGGSSSEGSCVIDAVFQPDPVGPEARSLNSPAGGGTFFALDVLSWGGRDLSGCDAAFRLRFWLPTKLSEAGCCPGSGPGSAAAPPLPAGVARVVPLVALEASPEGILAAVSAGSGSGGGGGNSSSSSFVRDGVLFLHRDSGYSCDEASPLALVWKDASCSRYVVETDAQGRALERQVALLRVVEVEGGGGFLAAATGDDLPVPLAPVPAPLSQDLSSSPEQQQQQQLSYKPGRLLRFAVGPAGLSFGANGDGGNGGASASSVSVSVSADLEFLSVLPPSSNRSRGAGGGADTLSKLLFQHAARHGLLPTLEGLLETARRQSRCPSSRGGEGDGEEAMNLG